MQQSGVAYSSYPMNHQQQQQNRGMGQQVTAHGMPPARQEPLTSQMLAAAQPQVIMINYCKSEILGIIPTNRELFHINFCYVLAFQFYFLCIKCSDLYKLDNFKLHIFRSKSNSSVSTCTRWLPATVMARMLARSLAWCWKWRTRRFWFAYKGFARKKQNFSLGYAGERRAVAGQGQWGCGGASQGRPMKRNAKIPTKKGKKNGGNITIWID